MRENCVIGTDVDNLLGFCTSIHFLGAKYWGFLEWACKTVDIKSIDPRSPENRISEIKKVNTICEIHERKFVGKSEVDWLVSSW